jgi:hypothetical protein
MLNILKVFDHAHSVFGPVSFVLMFMMAARKIFTLKAEFCFSILKHFAVFNFALGPGNGFIPVVNSAAKTFIF